MVADLTIEQQWIEIIKGLAGDELIGDDCAILPDGALATTDMLIEGNHFLLDKVSLRDLGWKSLAVNLSDIAAMGGVPEFATVGLGLPPSFSHREFEQLYAGIVECANAFQTRIAGGDLTRSDKVVISVSLLGKCGPEGALLRKTARPGQAVVVTGDFGASAAGLWLLLTGTNGFPWCRRRHSRPAPRVHEARQLAKLTGGAGALMDASDGLADALIQIARQSQVSIKIEGNQIPIHEETQEVAMLSAQSALDLALYGGEDFELVATVPVSAVESLKAAGFVEIGTVVERDADPHLAAAQMPGDQESATGNAQANSQASGAEKRCHAGTSVQLCMNGVAVQEIAAEKTFQHWQGC